MKIYRHIIFVFLLMIASSLSGEIYANHKYDGNAHIVHSNYPPPYNKDVTNSAVGISENNHLSQHMAAGAVESSEYEVATSHLRPSKFERSVAKKDLPTKTIFALKSNLLYDALSLVNFSVEVPLADKFSLLYYHQFPWWRWGKANNQYCLRFLSIGGEVRWWFSPKPKPATERRIARDRLVGHFFGIYSESGRWDFQHKRDICHQGEFWSVGLSYGYAMPIGRRLNLELSLSAGYASIPYRGYTPSEDYKILWKDDDKVGRWSYFGLTKAQVSLVVPITAKSKKGGSR